MSNFSIKSILLGMGIGIFITCIAGLLYSMGVDPLKNLNEKDFKKLEERYGLVKKVEVESESLKIIE